MDLLIFVVSSASLTSPWVQRELGFAVSREAARKETLILPFLIDDTSLDELPWFLSTRNARRVRPDSSGAEEAVVCVKELLRRRANAFDRGTKLEEEPRRHPEIDKLLEHVQIGDWNASEISALTIIEKTDARGQNELFQALLRYQTIDDDEVLWAALQVTESCVRLAPWLIDHQQIDRMSKSKNFTVRASASHICMELANVAPDRAPIDILMKLSVFDEDWYVQAPANAALKTLVRSMPSVLHIFRCRLDSRTSEERIHAAVAILHIALTEPELLDESEIQQEIAQLESFRDKDAISILQKALFKMKGSTPAKKYRYGL